MTSMRGREGRLLKDTEPTMWCSRCKREASYIGAEKIKGGHLLAHWRCASCGHFATGGARHKQSKQDSK